VIPFVVSGNLVSLQATGGLSAEEVKSAELNELCFRIAANVESQIDSSQEMGNDEFTKIQANG